jgi:hypothetical protein
LPRHRERWRAYLSNAPPLRDKATLHTESHNEKPMNRQRFGRVTPMPTRGQLVPKGLCSNELMGDRSVEIIWRPSTTREVKTIYAIPTTGRKLVRSMEHGRALDRAARQMVQCSEEDRACRLGDPKRDLPHSLRRRTHRRIGEGQGDLR